MMHKKTPEDLFKNFSKNAFEKAFWGENQTICGIDEVGRGCLAGPVVTAAVILPIGTENPLLNDSKATTLEERLKAYEWITTHCIYGVGIIHHRLIDKHNIWHATLIAMKRALMQALALAPRRPGAIVIDAMPLNIANTSYRDIPVHHFIKGEQRSSSIAAASIVAKVRRDAIMQHFDAIFPGYHLKDHKGYSTQKHQQALIELPSTIIHRTSFVPSYVVRQKEQDAQRQQRLC